MFNPNLPANLSVIDAEELREQFNGLKALIDLVLPVGGVIGYLKSLPNAPALPGTWVECNGQAINDAGSPLNGLNAPDLNGAQGGVPVFLRGATTSGGLGGAETHSHGLPLNSNGGLVPQGADVTVFPRGMT